MTCGSVLASKGLARLEGWNLALDAASDSDEVIGSELALQDLHNRHDLLSSNVHLILGILSTCPLEETRLVC